MMMTMLSDKAFQLDHNWIEGSEGGCILLPTQETIHIVLLIISDYRAVQLMIFLLSQRVISSWLKLQWLSCPLVQSTKQCLWCSSCQIVLLGIGEYFNLNTVYQHMSTTKSNNLNWTPYHQGAIQDLYTFLLVVWALLVGNMSSGCVDCCL